MESMSRASLGVFIYLVRPAVTVYLQLTSAVDWRAQVTACGLVYMVQYDALDMSAHKSC